MKKKVLSLALSVITAVSLAACGSTAAETGNASTAGTQTAAAAETSAAAAATTAAASDAASSDQITASGSSDALEVLIWDSNQQPGIQEILDEFTAKTGIKTDLQVKDWSSYWTLLEAAAQGGEMPDVMWMHSNVSQMYMKNGLLLNLDDYIKNSSEIKMDNFMPEVTELYTYNNSVYAIPKDYDTIALWYNKTMFDAAGISYPDETWTWDDLYDAAKKLTKADGSQYGIALSPSNNQDGYYNMVYSMGGYIVSDDKKTSGFDDPKTLKAMEYVAKLAHDCSPDTTTMSETSNDVLIESGTVAMTLQGSWMVPAYKSNDYAKANLGVAILPYDKETGTRASICNGLGWAASASSKRPDDCWKLLEWLGSKDMQLKQAQLGITMSAYLNTSSDWVSNTSDFDLKPYLDETTESTGTAKNKLVLRPYTYKTTVWEDAESQALLPGWQDPSQIDACCKSLAQEMNNDIAQENSD